ncbi:DNA mismatch repair endonuclease MutL [Paenibacillus hemerocallicola]|uniref:DNA mismatch repair protein MutL n=1 Tax=Paenibacillus hemerocallicola TaxID=1172614 RepID=A0A5C4T277_9BACL|nr:DNA mismatch repair endonuclease MutL [Paenibacillus hemerocallicola]TNJ63113.1 DNA mismatch repair endonuclease MutL [Paenibacillus hemerocallicola]
MGKIKVLDEHVANQIAAGEVIERPSSVVKELVENSLDAGSTKIDVTVEEGGLQLIRVSDNGSGIETEDCEVAFFRHATSKIGSGKDLFQIRTLGFRGEALPSIAAVAKVDCVSSPSTDGLGRRLVIEGGSVKSFTETASSRGTDMTVKELFYNTPARLKYMKTIQTELGHISDYIYRLAMAHPNVAFSLKHNGNALLQTLGNGDLVQVIAAVYGTAVAKTMLPVRAENADYSLSGFISRPDMTRSNRQALTMVMNGRTIRNYAVSNAILNAYHTLLPINRYPVVALHVGMDPALVDVNVHPAKLEVRFSKELELVRFVEEELRGVLRGEVLIPQVGKPTPKSAVVQERMELYRTAAPEPADLDDTYRNAPLPEPPAAGEPEQPSAADPSAPNAITDSSTVRAETDGNVISEIAATANPYINESKPDSKPSSSQAANGEPDRRSDAAVRSESNALPSYRNASSSQSPSRTSGSYAGQSEPKGGMPFDRIAGMDRNPDRSEKPAAPKFPQLDPIGQMHGTYIVAQSEDGLFLIDQHAAHERINYEHYYKKFGRPAEASQQLLVPITLEFTSAEAETLRGKLQLLEQVGVDLEPFGGGAFLVRGLPHWFPAGEEKALVEEMTDWLLSEKKSIDLTKLREKAAIMCSCKASIKANQHLSKAEIESLLDRLAACRNPYTCPHGRPIVVSFSTYELEKMFKRVM